jgi:signal recognition particle subunit SEC65
MIDAGASWSAEQIQAAVEEAGYDIDVEDAARPDFHIPETNR